MKLALLASHEFLASRWMTRGAVGIIAWSLLGASPASATLAPKLADRLKSVRQQSQTLERQILENLRARKQGQQNLTKIRALIQLQAQERILSKKRMDELNRTVAELEARRTLLNEKIRQQHQHARRYIRILESAARGDSSDAMRGVFGVSDRDRLDAPRRKSLSSLVQLSMREVETLKIDLQDARELESVIEREKNQLAFMAQDLEEQQSVMELNRQLQVQALQETSDERIAQLENYQRLKESEGQVEQLIEQFNARKELERTIETERATARLLQGLPGVVTGAPSFARIKGQLPLPMDSAKVVSAFGKGFDPKSRLVVFRKGIELAGGAAAGVRAVFAGRVAYAGELPEYGKVAIVDHGEHYFTLCAFLGNLTKKVGEPVQAGELVGWSSADARPVYFEIRSRNVPVNPLQWLSASFTLSK